VADTAEVVNGLGTDHGSTASPLRARHWRIVDRLGEEVVRKLLRDSRTGTPQRELAERYGISVSSVKRILRH
jgi:DNA invertase Pin-like site-specific DNA recombinase